MKRLRVWCMRLAGLFNGNRAEQELADEMESHLALHIEANLEAGMTPAGARREALLKLGGMDLVKEQYRDQRRLPLVSAILQDARFALRTMRRSAGLTAVAILTLALGIGANTAMFSVVYGVLLRPLPYRDPARLVSPFSTSPSRGFQNFGTSPPDYRELRDRNQTLASLSAYYPAAFNLSGDLPAERLPGSVVSTEFFDTLGVQPMLGRTFRPEEGTWGSHHVVVISESLWKTRFAAREDIVGTALRLNGQTYRVAGVMPAGFYFPGEPKLWAPMAWRPGDVQDSHNNYFLNMVARLKPGVTIERAHADLDAIMGQIAVRFPENKGVGASVIPLDEAVVGDVRSALWVLLAAVGFVLLIGCVNLSSLLLSRDSARRKEFALRAALGAGRGRLLGQFLTENVMLALVGGLAALALAYGAVAQVRTLAVDIPRIQHVAVNPAVLAFAFAVSIGSGILSGLLPCLWGTRTDLNEVLRQGGRIQQLTSGGSGRLRGALIMFEVALAFVLTIGAGLMLQSFGRLLRVDTGFDPRNVLTFGVSLPNSYTAQADPNDLAPPPRMVAFYDELIQRITRLPGVTAAAVTSALPLSGNNWTKYLSFDGRPVPASLDKVPMVQFRATDGDYFRAMGIRLREGRFFEPGDNRPGVPVALINAALARRFFPNEDPVGKLIWMAPPESLLPPGAVPAGFRFPRSRIVGVVEDVHYGGLKDSPPPEVYAPLAQSDWLPTMAVAVRTSVKPGSLVASIRSEMAAMDRNLPMAHIATMEEAAGSAVALPRVHTWLLGVFGLLALGLAAVGLYGVIAQAVAQRRHEVGVRIALGARPGAIVATIVARAMTLVAVGLAAGCGLALFLTRLMASLLFGITPTDPRTFAGAAVALIVTGAAASYLPARRAAAVDPIATLRCD
jgi:predicted permease